MSQIQVTGEAKIRNLEGVLTGTSGVVNSLAINVPNGIPQLDGSGKILVNQLPNSVMEYKGSWNAATNTPTLANGTGNAGDVYLCEVAGTVNFGAGPIAFFVGDQVVYSGSIWQRASGATGTVTSVAVTESGDALTITGSPITTSGTINIGFAGTSGQYINGTGNLTTFPSLADFVTLSTTQTITGTKTFNEAIRNESGLLLKNGVISGLSGYTSLGGNISNGLVVQLSGSTNQQNLLFQTGGAYSYTFPASNGTLALTSDLSSYVPTSRQLTINGTTYDLSANRSWTISTGITGSGTAGEVAYFNGTTSLTSEGSFNYDASTNRLGVNTSVPNATIGANANTDGGYSLLLKNGNANYNSIGFSTDSTYGNMITADRVGAASSRNLTLYNYAGYISLTEAGNLGVGILTPNTGVDIYNSTTSQLWLHNAATGVTSNDGVRLALFNNKNANLRNLDGAFSITAEGDFSIITIGAENLRVNSANGYVGIGNPATLPTMLTVNGGATITGLTTGQILFPTSGGTLSGSSNLFWNNSNTELSIGTSTSANRRLTIFSSSDANHLSLISNVPAITFSSNSSYTYYAGIGMATANNNFITGAVAGDLVLGTFNTNNIWFINNNTNTTRMRLDSDGGGTFSGFVSASGPKSQIRVNGNSVGCGISLTHTIVGANRRNWGIFTEENVDGDFVIERSTTSGGTPNTPVLSLSRDGAATFSSLGTGTVNATSGTLSTVSDMNLKDEDGFIDNALQKVLNLKPRYFYWKEETGLPTDLRQLGFYAQEVNEALGEEAANTPKTENDKWGIYDRGMIAFLTAAIQEQQLQIEELKTKIK
jgi:hypothetical protein